jgi:hypothetical protein
MKKLTKYFFALIALFLICYLSTAFINANVDFTKWDLHSRTGMIIVWAMLFICSIMPLSLMDEK